jgi:hypothetical protein
MGSKKISIICEQCNLLFERRNDALKKSKAKYGKNLCIKCSFKIVLSLRPSPRIYWTTEKREAMSKSVKSNPVYYESIKLRKSIVGALNPMYGIHHSSQTKAKMSTVRRGRFGKNANGWKGGKMSLNRRVKSYIQKNYKWFSKIFERDKVCQKCESNSKLDAHHIEPISNIIKRITLDKIFLTEDEKFIFIVNNPEIADLQLNNGVCLCRTCHKKAHIKWGSHYANSNNK